MCTMMMMLIWLYNIWAVIIIIIIVLFGCMYAVVLYTSFIGSEKTLFFLFSKTCVCCVFFPGSKFEQRRQHWKHTADIPDRIHVNVPYIESEWRSSTSIAVMVFIDFHDHHHHHYFCTQNSLTVVVLVYGSFFSFSSIHYPMKYKKEKKFSRAQKKTSNQRIIRLYIKHVIYNIHRTRKKNMTEFRHWAKFWRIHFIHTLISWWLWRWWWLTNEWRKKNFKF